MNYYQDDSNIQGTNPNPQANIDNRGGLPNASRTCGIISLILGILSVTTCCLGYLCIPVGALGIIFAILSRRLGKQLPPPSITGLTLSIIGIVMGIIMLVFTIYYTITNPLFWEQTQQIQELYEELYGIELEEYPYDIL